MSLEWWKSEPHFLWLKESQELASYDQESVKNSDELHHIWGLSELFFFLEEEVIRISLLKKTAMLF